MSKKKMVVKKVAKQVIQRNPILIELEPAFIIPIRYFLPSQEELIFLATHLGEIVVLPHYNIGDIIEAGRTKGKVLAISTHASGFNYTVKLSKVDKTWGKNTTHVMMSSQFTPEGFSTGFTVSPLEVRT